MTNPKPEALTREELADMKANVSTMELIRFPAQWRDNVEHIIATLESAWAENERLRKRYERPRQAHACDLPGCTSCGNPEIDYDYIHEDDDP